MSGVPGVEIFFWLAIIVILEVSIHLRFRPIKIQLATIEVLLRRDGSETTAILAEHADRIEALEIRLEDHVAPKRG